MFFLIIIETIRSHNQVMAPEQFTICPLVADQFLKFPFSTPVCFPFFALYEEILESFLQDSVRCGRFTQVIHLERNSLSCNYNQGNYFNYLATLFKARFIRRISAVSNAIETIDNEMICFIIFSLNCIRQGRNATYEPGLSNPKNSDCF